MHAVRIDHGGAGLERRPYATMSGRAASEVLTPSLRLTFYLNERVSLKIALVGSILRWSQDAAL